MNRYKLGMLNVVILTSFYCNAVFSDTLGQVIEKQSEAVSDNTPGKLDKTLVKLSVEESGLLQNKSNRLIQNTDVSHKRNRIKSNKTSKNNMVISETKITEAGEKKRKNLSVSDIPKIESYQTGGYMNNGGGPGHNNLWRVERGSSLFNTLSQWAADAGWSLVWKVDTTYQVLSTATFSGDFTSAVKQLFSSSGMQDINIYLNFYMGNKVLLVTGEPSD
ncbi:hypothetical protein BMK33_002280 [Shigella flexneri]|nr:hypothetical protein [Shigella flexneri]